ncbi:MAG: branched-chain amino acid ABC transporter permease, partial [Acidimicrobiia bacterium]
MTTRGIKFRFSFVDSFLWAVRIGAVIAIVVGIIGSVDKSISGEGLTLSAWRDLVITGLSQGSMYGLIALGYSMVYGVLGFINFAHGEVFMSGALVGFFVADELASVGLWDDNPVLAIGIVMLVSMATSTLVAVLVERIAYRPLRGAPRLIPLITSIGMSFFLQYTFRGLFGGGIKSYPQAPESLRGNWSIFGVEILKTKAIVIVVAAIAMVALYQFVERTKTGRAMRAVAEDKEIAGLMGINVDRTIVTTFAVGGAMAGIAGTLWSLLFRQVFFFTGFLPGIKAFTAAVLGGIGNMVGAMLGGVSLGLFESVGPQLVLDGLGVPAVSQLKDVVAFVALVLVLIFRPTGL